MLLITNNSGRDRTHRLRANRTVALPSGRGRLQEGAPVAPRGVPTSHTVSA